ncbi:MAG TPA: DUF2892 domain-containing protein [Gallionellaceae bacterium]
MNKNVGTIDRIVRVLLGLALIGGGMYSVATLGIWAYVLAVVGLVLLGTAVFSFCPIWMVLGVNTCETKPGGSK